MSTVLRISSFLKCPRVRQCEYGGIPEGPLFPYPDWWIQLLCGWMEQLWMPGCGFPGLKGRTNAISILPSLCYLMALIINCYGVANIRELVGWLQLFSLANFVDSVRVHSNNSIVKRLQIRPGFFRTPIRAKRFLYRWNFHFCSDVNCHWRC